MSIHPLLVTTAAVLMLAGCAAAPPKPSLTDTARAAFGSRLEPYQGNPSSAMVADLGAPDHDSATSEGGRMLVWERKETKVVDGKTLNLDCKITALTAPDGMVTGVVGGGSTLFCARVFAVKG